jgi:hypothetical protein
VQGPIIPQCGPSSPLFSTPRRANAAGSGAPAAAQTCGLSQSPFASITSALFSPLCREVSHQLQSFHGVPHSFAKTTRGGTSAIYIEDASAPPASKCPDFISGQSGKDRQNAVFAAATPLLPTHPRKMPSNSFASHTSTNKGLKPLYFRHIQKYRGWGLSPRVSLTFRLIGFYEAFAGLTTDAALRSPTNTDHWLFTTTSSSNDRMEVDTGGDTVSTEAVAARRHAGVHLAVTWWKLELPTTTWHLLLN